MFGISIVLQWRINGIASWMTLKSWRVSAVLKYFLVASASCHLAQPTSSDQHWEHSNLFWRSSFSLQDSIAPSSSRGSSPCRRRVFVSLIELSSWFNINPFSFKNWYSPWRWTSSGRSSRLCFFSLASSCKRKYFRLRCGALLLDVVVLLVDQVCDQFVQVMRNSEPRVRIAFIYRFWFPLHIFLASSWLWLLTRVQFWCSLQSNLSGQLICRLVVTCTHNMSLALQNVRLVSVFCHEVLSDLNSCQESCINTNLWSHDFVVRACISTNLYQSICLWKLFHSFFVLLQYIFCARLSIENVGVVINKSAGAKNGSNCSATTSLPVLVRQILYSSHKFETAP